MTFVLRGIGTVHVFTFKEGIFSPIAHDLRLSSTELRVELDDERVLAELRLDSLAVDGVVGASGVDDSALTREQKQEIRTIMLDRILRSGRHPVTRFSGSAHARDGGFSVEGALDLRGVTRPLTLEVIRGDPAYRLGFELRPTEFGIRPYRALLGAIRLQDRLRVEAFITEL